MSCFVEVKDGYGRNGCRSAMSARRHHNPQASVPKLYTGISRSQGLLPVDEHFPPSVALGRIPSGDDRCESTPGHRCSNTSPGPRRPNGDDRLMDTVQATPDTAPDALCPTCGQRSVAASKRLEMPGVAVADYRDGAGHIWTTKWLVAA